MTTATITTPLQCCERCHRTLSAAPGADTGFGYSREPDTTDRPEPVPAGVDLHFFTGRTPRRAAA